MRRSVNSIFNPSFVDSLYPRPAAQRRNLISETKATNYGVVRLELIEHLYERMYDQRRELGPDEKDWPHRIMARREILGVADAGDKLRINVGLTPPPGEAGSIREEEALDADLIISATGYRRNAHVDILRDTWPLLPEYRETKGETELCDGRDWWQVKSQEGQGSTKDRVIEVGRDYGVRFAPDKVASGSGIWLQGCCEGTHGVSVLPSLIN